MCTLTHYHQRGGWVSPLAGLALGKYAGEQDRLAVRPHRGEAGTRSLEDKCACPTWFWYPLV